MDTRTRTQRRYDHRFRDLVRTTRDIDGAVRRGVPRSTARSWLTKSNAQVVTVDVLDMNTLRLQEEILRLRARVHKLTALLRVLLVVLRISRASQNLTRLSDDRHKRALLQAIDRSRSVFPLRAVLRVIRLSPSCYHAWNRPEPCARADPSSCPRSFPQQLTAAEVRVIHEMVTSEAYRHVSTGTLARLAQRLGEVFASASTWYRLVRQHQWRRPRQRVHPAAPKLGIRASRPNEIWHVDTTMLRLLDGSRAYLHAVIDNFSRRILAWKVAGTFDPSATAAMLLSASTRVMSDIPLLLADGGVETSTARWTN
jgi:transposase InsO family protein